MTFTNGGQRDERHPNRGVTRQQYDADIQDALAELNAASGVMGDSWPGSAWSPGESRTRSYTYSKYTGSPDAEDLAMESRTAPGLPAGVHGVKYSDSNDFEPYEGEGYQAPPGYAKSGRQAYSRYTGADAPSDDDMMFDSMTAQLESPNRGTLPSGVKPFTGRSTYSKYNPNTYQQYDND